MTEKSTNSPLHQRRMVVFGLPFSKFCPMSDFFSFQVHKMHAPSAQNAWTMEKSKKKNSKILEVIWRTAARPFPPPPGSPSSPTNRNGPASQADSPLHSRNVFIQPIPQLTQLRSHWVREVLRIGGLKVVRVARNRLNRQSALAHRNTKITKK